MSTSYDLDLQSYFTDMEHLRGMFAEYVSAPTLPKRLIVFHGVGGVGKSSLLRMFRLHCKNEKIPVGLASGDDAKSVLEVITRWTEDLKVDGIKFPALSKTLEAYRTIQAKVEDQVKKSQNRVADIASKAASKTAETAGGAFLGAAIGSIIPGMGTAIGGALGGVVSGMGADALTDWLRGFLTKPDIDLLLDPAKKLSADFLEDIAKAAGKKRLLLLLDTFEQMSALEEWVGETARKIHPNALVVIAGRKLPDWNRVWSGWMLNAQVEELKPMTEDIMRALIHRYYATMRGGEPAPAQVEAIIRFARGLPMVVTSAVQLWVKYGVEDFQSVKAEIVANLVDRLIEGVPGNLIPALEAAAAVRWFDQPILRAVMKQDDVRDVYNELRRFPFVRTRVEGLALHDSVREMLDENLRVQDSERYAELHERAATYFEKRLEQVSGEEAERLGLERLYHRVRVNETDGIKLFQVMAEELSQYRLVNRLRVFLNDANTYPIERAINKLWREYYNIRLAEIDSKGLVVAQGYEAIAYDLHSEQKLRAYALCDLGGTISRWQYLGKPGGISKAMRVLQESLQLTPIDHHLANNLFSLAHTHQYSGEWDEALECLEKARKFYKEQQNTYGLMLTYAQFMVIRMHRGQFGEICKIEEMCKPILSNIPQHSYARAQIMAFASASLYTGRYAESEKNAKESLNIISDIGDKRSSLEPMRWLSLALAMQDKYSDANAYCAKHLDINQEMGSFFVKDEGHGRDIYGIILTRQGKYDEANKQLIRSLSIKEEVKETLWIPATLTRLGVLQEILGDWENALGYFQNSITRNVVDQQYFKSEALAGLFRSKYHLKDFSDIRVITAVAEQIAQQNEFYNHLASLRLTQGHLAWERDDQAEALAFYQQAMLYALRYNRFLLDELVSGRPQGTPLSPIVPACLERGAAGKTMLLALRDWWKTSVNDIGAPRPDTISPIPEGLALLEAEKMAREREPGDGSAQKNIIQQIEAAL